MDWSRSRKRCYDSKTVINLFTYLIFKMADIFIFEFKWKITSLRKFKIKKKMGLRKFLRIKFVSICLNVNINLFRQYVKIDNGE